jgi:DNA polymerase-3 subunit gamma/tau
VERPPRIAPAATTAQPLPTTDGALALAPEAPQPSPSNTYDIAALHSALIAALAAVKGQQTASDAIHDATLTLAPNIGPPDTLQVNTTLSKTMLPVVLNAEAERLLKAALHHAAPTLKLALLPGAPAANGAKKPARPAPVGSATELAEKHPMVQEAKRLFSAEISNVIDLRDKD